MCGLNSDSLIPESARELNAVSPSRFKKYGHENNP